VCSYQVVVWLVASRTGGGVGFVVEPPGCPFLPLSGWPGGSVMKFGLLPDEEPAARSLSEFEMALLEWDTTPSDLRAKGEKSLTGFCESRKTSSERCLRAMQKDWYKLARRQLSIEKGELDYKTRTILAVAYEQALKGNPAARKDWMAFYQPLKETVEEIKIETPTTNQSADPMGVTEMSDTQLAEALKEWADSE